MSIEADGSHVIAGVPVRGRGSGFHAVSPESGTTVGPEYVDASHAEVDRALGAAVVAFPDLSRRRSDRIVLLGVLARLLEGSAAELIRTADVETSLGETRLRAELSRTSHQLRLFARLLEEASYVSARIDPAEDGPPRRPDLRRMLRPCGPVAVFTAASFPLAWGAAGGDTGAALAAGCPVIVKSHPSHPSTGEVVARLVASALEEVGLPSGSFSLLHGRSRDVGRSLVGHPDVSAVTYTGSQLGGRALMDLAAQRPKPVPVFANMGSSNPVVFSAGALSKANVQKLADGYVSSLMECCGQLCTKPGVLLLPGGDAGDRFLELATEALRCQEPGSHLSEGDARQLLRDVAGFVAIHGVKVRAVAPRHEGGVSCEAGLLEVPVEALERASDALMAEYSGPVGVVLRYRSQTELRDAIRRVPGSLAGSVQVTEAELPFFQASIRELEQRVERVVYGDWPTGVAVTSATHHGGPYPATSDGQYTSVGTASLDRFIQGIAYQDAPEAMLPEELRDENPLKIMRLVDGRWTREPIWASGPHGQEHLATEASPSDPPLWHDASAARQGPSWRNAN